MILSPIRILEGSARGRRLFSVRGYQVRPALARVRGSVFNILRGRFDGAPVADLYAGTGSVGFEALSRGASLCCFVERSRELLEVLRANAEKLDLAARTRVLAGEVLGSAGGLPAGCACVFADPPYALWDDERERAELAAFLGALPGRGILAADGRVVVEHRKGDLPDGPLAGLALADRRGYGQTEVSFYAAEAPA